MEDTNMPDASKSVQIKDYPTKIVVPTKAPDWFIDHARDHSQSIEQWAREIAAALRQAQAKIAALEGK